MGRLAAYAAGEVGRRNYRRAASLRRRATVLASGILSLSTSCQGAYQRAGYKPVPRSVLRVLKVVNAACGLKRSALNQCGSNVSAATFRYTRGPAVRTTTQVSPKLSGSEQPSSIISLMVWAGGAVEQPTITVNMAAQVFDDVVNKFCP
jgi:hypothetical protein